MDGWRDEWVDMVDGWLNGWLAGWLDGRMDGVCSGVSSLDGRSLSFMVEFGSVQAQPNEDQCGDGWAYEVNSSRTRRFMPRNRPGSGLSNEGLEKGMLERRKGGKVK